MSFLYWAGEHPILTIVILMVVSDGLVHVARAVRS